MTMTFEAIRAQAEAPNAPYYMYQYTAAAAQNASDTIAEGEADESQFDDLALGTLQSILCNQFITETDADAAVYFASLGVRW